MYLYLLLAGVWDTTRISNVGRLTWNIFYDSKTQVFVSFWKVSCILKYEIVYVS